MNPHTLLLTGLLAVSLSSTSASASTGRSNVAILRDHVLSEEGSTRATGYVMSNKIVTVGRKTFVTWLDTNAVIRMQTFDHATGRPGKASRIGQGVDNHAGPALTADAKGHLHIVFGPHHGPFQYRHTTRPRDANDWSPVVEFGENCTYPSLVCAPNGTLHLTCRGGDVPCKLHYYRKPPEGRWTGPVTLAHADVPNGYTQYGNSLAVARDGTLHLAFHFYDLHPPGGKAVAYMKSADGGKTWTRADGRPLSLPVTPKSSEAIEAGAKLDMRAGNVTLDPKGRPYLVVAYLDKTQPEAKLWHHDGEAWRSTPLSPWVAKTVDPAYRATGGVVEFGGDGRLYVALTIAKEFTWGDPSNEIALLVSADGGKTFTGQMMSPPDPKTPNWLPSLERRTGHNRVDVPWLITTHGHPGEGCTPKIRTDVRLVALDRWESPAKASTVRVGGVVLKWTPKDKALSWRRVEPMIRRAAARGAKIVCTTESCLDGYSIRDKKMPIEEFRALAEEIPGGKYVQELQALAKELKIHIVAGLLRRIEDRTYNAAVVIDPNGAIVGVYHKQHLGHEKVRNTAGDACPTFDTPYGKLGVMICADRRYPEVTAGLIQSGAEFILIPSGGMWGPAKNDHHVRARSRQSGVPIVFVHPIEWLVTGPDGTIWDRDFRGHTMDTKPEDVDTHNDPKGVFLFDLPINP